MSGLHFFVFRINIFARESDTIVFGLLLFGNEQVVLCFQ